MSTSFPAVGGTACFGHRRLMTGCTEKGKIKLTTAIIKPWREGSKMRECGSVSACNKWESGIAGKVRALSYRLD